tara:strand:- start:231 stop:467 length:237 start_codon:yes stop_codon:yes gene_type:complete
MNDEHEEEEWYCEFKMGIHDVRSLYSSISFALETWPGSPRRPLEEQEYLIQMKQQLFAMLAEYTFTHIESGESNEGTV